MAMVKSTQTRAVMLDLGNTMLCMQICKGSTTILVVQSHEIVVVVDRYLTVNNEPFIKLAKVFNRPNQAYVEWLRVVGKMCKKASTSKYFDAMKPSEHLTNGEFPEYMKNVVLEVAKAAVSSCDATYESDVF